MISGALVITLLEVPSLGPRKAKAILQTFPDVTSWRDLLDQDLLVVEGVSKSTIEKLRSADPAHGTRILDRAAELGIRYVHYWQDEFPEHLRDLYDAPVGLYLRGNGDMRGDFIAVVGTRQPTPYGRSVAKEMCHALIASGIGIVSGFARGVDTIAHQAALEMKGVTIAVLGCGVDVIYPSENKLIYPQIMEHGLFVSEYPPGDTPDGHHFPQRNRIISGLSMGVLVVEAGSNSGALITGHIANDQQREVFAIPGRIDSPKSAGCHELIQKGAKLVGKVEDLLEELSPPYSAPPGHQIELLRDLSEPERGIMEYLTKEPVQVDFMAEELDQNIAELLSVLLHLEMRGLVMQYAGKQFSRV